MSEQEVTLTAENVKLRADLDAALAEGAAMLHFMEAEMEWEFFREEYGFDDSVKTSAKNARKLQDFLRARGNHVKQYVERIEALIGQLPKN